MHQHQNRIEFLKIFGEHQHHRHRLLQFNHLLALEVRSFSRGQILELSNLAPPGFGSVISQPEQGDGLRSSLLIDSSMPLSVEDLERQQHFQRKVIEDSYSENGLRGGGISAPIGPPPSRQTDHRQSESGGIQDDPAVLATRIDTTGMQSPVTRRDEPVGTNQLHPQHRQMLRNNQKNNNRNNRNNQNRKQRDPYANLMSKRNRFISLAVLEINI